METVLHWLPTIFSFLTGILIAASLFNVIQSIQTIVSVCRLRQNQPLIKRIRKEDGFQFFGGVLVTTILSAILFYPFEFVAHYMQSIMVAEILYGLILFAVSERSFKCCDMIYKQGQPH